MPKPVSVVSPLVLSLTLALSACQQAAVPPPLPEISVVVGSSGFQTPATLQAGLSAITLSNTDQRAHYLELLRLKPGVNRAQVQAVLDSGNAPSNLAALDQLVSESGSTADVDSGGSNRVILDLAAGPYLLMDESATPDAPPVIVGSLSVTPRSGLAVPDPAFSVKAVGTDFGYDLPMSVKAGQQVWQFVNAGQQSHELVIAKLHSGKTVADVKTFFDQPNPDYSQVPGDLVGENAPISGGVREFFTLTLTPGNYVALCFVTDPATGKSHLDLGMIMGFPVTN